MKHRGIDLGRRGRESGGWRGRRVRQVVLLLVGGIDNVLVLASHLVEDKENTGLASLLHSRSALLKLLTIGVGQRCSRELLLTHAAKVHVAKLLSGQSKKLLLKLLLPLSEVSLSSKKLSSNSGVHLAIIVLHRGRSQDLVVKHVLLVELINTAKASTDSGLWAVLIEVTGQTVVLVSTDGVLALVVRRRSRGLSGRRGLRRSAKASKEVGAAGARSLNLVLRDRGDLGRRSDAETLEGGALTAGREARGRIAKALGLEVVVGHLSKTASVHAHFVFVGRLRKWGKAATRGMRKALLQRYRMEVGGSSRGRKD